MVQVRKIGDAQNRLGMFGFRYWSWSVRFTDGTWGEFCQNQKNDRFFVSTAVGEVYYIDKNAAINAAYHWAKYSKMPEEGRMR
ncbi:MAG: hypothetical protein EAZ55_04300 [Cytophagales bacterium]|nr:MAG: hypothetical protein EAZ55_04300 [Cytophagales bacterium]